MGDEVTFDTELWSRLPPPLIPQLPLPPLPLPAVVPLCASSSSLPRAVSTRTANSGFKGGWRVGESKRRQARSRDSRDDLEFDDSDDDDDDDESDT